MADDCAAPFSEIQKIKEAPLLAPGLAEEPQAAVDPSPDAALSAEKDGGTNSKTLQKATIPAWRRKHRFTHKADALTWFRRAATWHACLAIAFIVLGSAAALLFAATKIAAALITMATAMISCLVFVAGRTASLRNLREVEAMRARFENLEDRAWELRESEERYRNIAESFGDMLVMRRQDGTIQYCNPAFAECFGKTLAEVQGTNFTPQPVDASPVENGLGHQTREIAFETKNRQTTQLRWFAWLDLPVRDEKHGGTMTLSVARDITGFKQAERTLDAARDKAEQANRAKSRFLAMVSHEMRTPLNGILGMSKLLNGTKLTLEQKSYLDAVSNSGSSLLRLIEEMLDLTMIEAGRFQLHKETFDLKPLLTDVVELMSARAYAKGIGLGLFVDPAVPLQMQGDADRIRQVLLNLVGNAIKFTQKGGIAVHCRVNSMSDNHPDAPTRLCFDIADTGPGLSQADKARIFNEFERVDDGKNRKSGGAGLGLAISRAIATQMGGALALNRTSPKGSLFTFDLPANSVAPPPENHLLDNKQILLIGGDKMEAECISMQLSSHGAKIKIVDGGSHAHKTLAKATVSADAILLDPEALLKLPNSSPTGTGSLAKRPKIIVLVDPSERKSLAGYLEGGADAYLVRPVREDSLLAILSDTPPLAKIASEPLHSPSSPNAAPSVAPSAVKDAVLAGIQILLAEDNDINALLVTAILKKAGATIDRAVNGADAFSQFKTVKKPSKYDFVLMDMHMPVMDGLAAAGKIRKWEKRNKSGRLIPIFALSADDQADTRSDALEAGMNGFLIKPVDPDKLVEVILQSAKE